MYKNQKMNKRMNKQRTTPVYRQLLRECCLCEYPLYGNIRTTSLKSHLPASAEFSAHERPGQHEPGMDIPGDERGTINLHMPLGNHRLPLNGCLSVGKPLSNRFRAETHGSHPNTYGRDERPSRGGKALNKNVTPVREAAFQDVAAAFNDNGEQSSTYTPCCGP